MSLIEYVVFSTHFSTIALGATVHVYSTQWYLNVIAAKKRYCCPAHHGRYNHGNIYKEAKKKKMSD